MIYSLRGKVILKEPNLAVVECGGVGYGVRTSAVTVSKLPDIGQEATLYTYLHVAENAFDLFGFADSGELSCFKMLISINRVGPKAALGILSTVTPERFALCVAAGDAKTIAKAPGIGLKTAQRIILELKDKLAKSEIPSGNMAVEDFLPTASSNASEAVSALVVLGFSQADAAAAVGKLSPDTSVEEMIKTGLRILSGG